jgi:hypothetical protein
LGAQCGDDWELDRYWFFNPGSDVLREAANEGREAWFMVFTIKLGLMPSLERGLQWEIQEAAARASWEAYAVNNLPLISIGLILQEEIAFEQGEIGRHAKKDLTKMHKDDNLKDGVRVEMN